MGTCRCIVSSAIEYVGVAGAVYVGAGLVGEDGRLEIKCQGERYGGRRGKKDQARQITHQTTSVANSDGSSAQWRGQ